LTTADSLSDKAKTSGKARAEVGDQFPLGLTGGVFYTDSMLQQRCAADLPLAILSFHSHSDRSFLDDRELALLSGELRVGGIANDLVLVVLTPQMELGERQVEERLAERLAAYDPIVYERVWSPAVVERLRARLPGKTFIGLRGEHIMLESTPADVFCNGAARQILAPLVEWLRGGRALPPSGALLRRPREDGAGHEWVEPEPSEESPARQHPYVPNLRPIVVNPESLPAVRTFSVTGNPGCPYQRDARENPLYTGTDIPARYGRGCAFCTTGNHYEGHPNRETAASVLEQIRYVRRHAAELDLLVLKDQNPFGYLTEVVEQCESEGLSGFALLLETRAEWFLRNAERFERALAVARRIGVRLAPFLVGIENFSQPELDRFNKGIDAALNVEFLETLWRWKEKYGDALDLGHAAFGFILFSPWTTMADLATNLAAIEHTHFDRLRGSILLSRARLYPDTALYYLAKRDGLLVDEFASEADDASRRYGYYPSHPWRHAHADVAHFAELATAVAEKSGSRDMVNLFAALLDEFAAAGDGWAAITVDDVWRRYQTRGRHRDTPNDTAAPPLAPASDSFRNRFARLVQPLPLDGTFAGGWRFGPLLARPGHVEVELRHGGESGVVVELVRRGDGPCFRRSRHYDIRAVGRDLTNSQLAALTTLAQAIQNNDS
jgi:hypothetical protein